jgi:hypothetical protein
MLAELMLADIGNLVGLLIFAIIAILSAVLKKKQKAEEEDFELPPELRPPRDREPAPRARNWEEELRNLLEERPTPPPVVRHIPHARPAVPPPIMQPAESDWMETETSSEGPQHIPAPRFETVPFVPLEEQAAARRFAEATALHDRVAHQYLPGIHHAGTTSVERAKQSEEIVAVKDLLRTGRGARAAVIASIILGPPRALENNPY